MTDAAVARHTAVESAWIVDRFVLFDDRDGVVHELSPSASAVWGLIDGMRPTEALCGELSDRVGQDVSGDVRGALAEFAALRLLNDAIGDPA